MFRRKELYTCLLAAIALPAGAANIVIDPGTGFDDSTPSNTISDQQGNNPGATLGAMRLIVFQEAAAVWGGILNSNQTITVQVDFVNSIACAGSSAQLGHAGPTSTKENFGSGDPNIAYAIALAESLSGSNQNGGSAEITAEFNAKVDNDAGCLGGGGFYYGLDNNAPAGTTPIFATVLHEIGHGLGFVSYVTSNGSWLNGTMDPFSRELRDLQTGKDWENMSNAERQASQLNEPNLVWTGAQVTADRGKHLAAAPELKINAPAPVKTVDVNLGQQSTPIPANGLTRDVLDANATVPDNGLPGPADGCNQYTFSGDAFDDKIVLVDETSNCPVVIQVFIASDFEGAAGVMIAATGGTEPADVTGLLNGDINVPYVGITKAEADQLRGNIASANVTFQTSPTKYEGENQGLVKMYAPNPAEPGSSVSHWSSSATPDLLMEPSMGDLIFENVDLTAAAFKDIGWSVNIPGASLEVIYEDGFE